MSAHKNYVPLDLDFK